MRRFQEERGNRTSSQKEEVIQEEQKNNKTFCHKENQNASLLFKKKKKVCLLLQHLTRIFHPLSLSLFSYSLLFWTVNYRNVTHILGWSNSGYAKPNLAHSLCLDLSLSSPLCPIFLLEGRGEGGNI